MHSNMEQCNFKDDINYPLSYIMIFVDVLPKFKSPI